MSIAEHGVATGPADLAPRAASRAEWSAQRVLIVAGLALGVVLGQAGGFFKPGATHNLLLALSSVGLVTASLVMAIRQARVGRSLVAAGFGLLAVAEMLMWTGGPGSRASFAGAVMFYVPALLLISVPAALPALARMLGGAAAVPWAAFAGAYLIAPAASPSQPLRVAGYLLLSAAAIGWIVVVIRERG